MKLKEVAKTYSGLPKGIYIIFISRVVNKMGNFVYPLMTLLLTIKVGMSEEKIGLFMLVCAAVQLPGSLLGGKLADHIGRKKIITVSMSIAAASFLPCAFLKDYSLMPVFFISAAFFNSISGPASGAMVNDLTVPENRQRAFSLLYLGINFGSALGSVIAAMLFNNYIGDAVTSLIAIFLIYKYVDETKPTANQIEDGFRKDTFEKSEKGGLLSALLKRPLLLVFSLIDTIYSFVYAQSMFSMPLYSRKIFGDVLGPQYYGTFNMVNCLFVIFATTIIVNITKKVKDIYNISLAGIFFAAGFGMLYFVNSYWPFVISTIIWTTGEILNVTNIGVYIANRTPMTHRGRFNSIIDIISGTGFAIAPYVMGKYITVHGVGAVWPVIFVLALSAAFFMMILGIFENRNKTKEVLSNGKVF